MIKFVNAKINIGLNIVGKREDNYHELQTVFYPVGLECGLPHQPEPFDDILEVTYDNSDMSGCRFQFVGRQVDCEPRKNLVVKATTEFMKNYHESFDDLMNFGMFEITLDKHLPTGAGLGGGSADASFVLTMLNEVTGNKFQKEDLLIMAGRLGADCPFFIENRPCYASGIGEELSPIDLNLKGKTILIVKPDFSVSTAEAFSGIKPQKAEFDLRHLPELPIGEWKEYVKNDFENTVFEKYPELQQIKAHLYSSGAAYASMSGSGSAIYGIYEDAEVANGERLALNSTYQGIWVFGL